MEVDNGAAGSAVKRILASMVIRSVVADFALVTTEMFLLLIGSLSSFGCVSGDVNDLIKGTRVIVPRQTKSETVPENMDDSDSEDDDSDDDDEEGDDEADGDDEDFSGDEGDDGESEDDEPVANGQAGGSEDEEDDDDDDDVDETDEEDDDDEEDEEEEDEETPQPPSKKKK